MKKILISFLISEKVFVKLLLKFCWHGTYLLKIFTYFYKKKQKVAKAEAELAEVKDVEELSPEAMELLEFLAVSKEALAEQLAEGIAEIKEDLAELKVRRIS